MHRKRSIFFDYGSDLPGNGNIFIDYNYKDGAGNNSGIVQGFFAYVLLDLILVMLCSIAIYFLLYWKNKKIVMSDNEIIYYPIIGKVRTYSWNDVKKIYYKSGLRGHSRLVIETDKKIYIDCEMMKNCGETVKLIMKKGYLKTNI